MIRERTREPFTSEIGAKGHVACIGVKFQGRIGKPFGLVEEVTSVPGGEKCLPPMNMLTKGDGEGDTMRRVSGFAEEVDHAAKKGSPRATYETYKVKFPNERLQLTLGTMFAR